MMTQQTITNIKCPILQVTWALTLTLTLTLALTLTLTPTPTLALTLTLTLTLTLQMNMRPSGDMRPVTPKSGHAPTCVYSFQGNPTPTRTLYF